VAAEELVGNTDEDVDAKLLVVEEGVVEPTVELVEEVVEEVELVASEVLVDEVVGKLIVVEAALEVEVPTELNYSNNFYQNECNL
jgi:hypothetical protein